MLSRICLSSDEWIGLDQWSENDRFPYNPALEPIPGSITYGGTPHAKLQKSPVGSSVVHVFQSGGSEYEERYIVMPDRNLRLVSRTRRSNR